MCILSVSTIRHGIVVTLVMAIAATLLGGCGYTKTHPAEHCSVTFYQGDSFQGEYFILTGGSLSRDNPPSWKPASLYVQGENCFLRVHGARLEEGFHPKQAIIDRTGKAGIESEVSVEVTDEDLHYGEPEACTAVLYEDEAFDVRGKHEVFLWNATDSSVHSMYNQKMLVDMNDLTTCLHVVEKGCAVTVYVDGDFTNGSVTFLYGWHPKLQLQQAIRDHSGDRRISSLVVHPEPYACDGRDACIGHGAYLHDSDDDSVPDHESSTNPLSFPRIYKFETRSVCYQSSLAVAKIFSEFIYYFGYLVYVVVFLFVLMADTLRLWMGVWFKYFPVTVVLNLFWAIVGFVLTMIWALLCYLFYGLYCVIFGFLWIAEGLLNRIFGTFVGLMLTFVGLMLLVLCYVRFGSPRLAQKLASKPIQGVIFVLTILLILLKLLTLQCLAWYTVQVAYCPLRAAIGGITGAEDAFAYWIAAFSLSHVNGDSSHFQ